MKKLKRLLPKIEKYCRMIVQNKNKKRYENAKDKKRRMPWGCTHTHTDNLLTEKNKVNKAIQINLEKCRSW